MENMYDKMFYVLCITWLIQALIVELYHNKEFSISRYIFLTIGTIPISFMFYSAMIAISLLIITNFIEISNTTQILLVYFGSWLLFLYTFRSDAFKQ